MFTTIEGEWDEVQDVIRRACEAVDAPRVGLTLKADNELIAAVDHWSEHWNDDPKPFVWHRTAEEIIAKVRRGRAALDRVTRSATDH